MKKMKTTLWILFLCGGFLWFPLMPPSTQAFVTIEDHYIGAAPTNSHYYGRDVIGADAYFDISRMEVSFLPNGWMYVDIYTRYLDNISLYLTQLGDLFISTTGWKPYGSSPYKDDQHSNGEQWEYALVMDNHVPGSGPLNGTAYLYPVSEDRILLSWAPAGYIYRAGQEVQFNPKGLTPLSSGFWSIVNSGGLDTDDYLRFEFEYGSLGNVSQLGFHWTMTCANDVIEGVDDVPAHTPEPATMVLVGTGMIGLAGFVRKKFGRKDLS